ncbi:MAG: hypothetical protein EB084_19965 [Proteobacteria bacterium]|nr:hypothetical protein [Pseudomonadota bacterium]
MLLVVGFIVLYPPFFWLIWRPHRIRAAHALKLEGLRRFAEEAGAAFDASRYPLDLSHAWHRRLHLDPADSTYRAAAIVDDEITAPVRHWEDGKYRGYA